MSSIFITINNILKEEKLIRRIAQVRTSSMEILCILPAAYSVKHIHSYNSKWSLHTPTYPSLFRVFISVVQDGIGQFVLLEGFFRYFEDTAGRIF
jgi:hypothetical protein